MHRMRLKIKAESQKHGVLFKPFDRDDYCSASSSEKEQAVSMLTELIETKPVLFNGHDEVKLVATLEVTLKDPQKIDRCVKATCSKSEGCFLSDEIASGHGENLQAAVIEYLKRWIFDNPPIEKSYL